MRINREVYIFVGPPGCGKGTLSSLCVNELSWVQLSTGNMCRKHIIEGTEIGKTIDFVIKSGKLISDNMITDLVKTELEAALRLYDSVILDGFPRTEGQAKLLFDIIKDKKLDLHIIRFNVDYDIIVHRLTNRVVCSDKDCQAVYSLTTGSSLLPQKEGACDKCNAPLFRREDDKSDVIIKRLKEYDKQADQVVNFYKDRALPVSELLVDKPIHEVFHEFKKLIGKL